MTAELLIIEDDIQMQHLLAVLFGDLGYHVSAESNVRSALHRLSNEVPDVVLLDLCLPETDGIAFLKLFRQYIQADARIPSVVVLSSVDDPEVIDDALQNGARAYIIKPFDIVGLAEQVQACLSDDT